MLTVYFTVNDGFEDQETRSMKVTREEARGIAKLALSGVYIPGGVTIYDSDDKYMDLRSVKEKT